MWEIKGSYHKQLTLFWNRKTALHPYMYAFDIIDTLQNRLKLLLPPLSDVEAKFSKFILMMSKTQVKNQESNKFQESKSRSIKNQESSEESRFKCRIKIQVKIQEKTQDMQELQEKHQDKYKKIFLKEKIE